MSELPVDLVLPELMGGLASHGSAVLVAPPGAGKSTRVPPALLRSGQLGDGQLWMLQPRRAAAKLVAKRIAQELGTELGDRVGYSVRFESARSSDTRIEVLTEGLLTRRLQSNPFLEGVSCVVFDEFHERSLHADLAFSLLREIQRDARPDLRILVMSATLDPEPIAQYLGGSPVVHAEGRLFPVDVYFEERVERDPIWKRCAAKIRQVLKDEAEGHVLAFLPGVGEIMRTKELLASLKGVDVALLHGRLPLAEQERALAPSRRRKVILSTNLAESAVTIEGVRAVVDTGLVRRARFEPNLGFSRLELMRVSRASAEQRAGRAGRTAPGRCYRLWTAGEHQGMQPFDPPEIRRSDLSNVLLELHSWGADPDGFAWFQAPKAAHMEQAAGLLERLGLLELGRITDFGRKALSLPLHPRLSGLVIRGAALGLVQRATAVAAILSEPDFVRSGPSGGEDCDLELRLGALDAMVGRGAKDRLVNQRALKNVSRVRGQLCRLMGQKSGPVEPNTSEFKKLLVDIFPERVGAQRTAKSDRYRLAGGQGVILDEESVARDQSLILALDVRAVRRGERADHRVSLAMPLSLDELEATEGLDTYFDREREAVVHRQVRRLGDLVLSEHQTDTKADPEVVAEVLAKAATCNPSRAFTLDKELKQFLARLRFLAEAMPELELPLFAELVEPLEHSDGSLIRSLCIGHRSFEELKRLDLLAHLKGVLGFAQVQALEAQAPERFKLPNGTHGRIRYADEGPPFMEARVQQLFGLKETPAVASGRVPLLLHILAPNQRPVQVTRDLKSFWAVTYAQVRKDLRGRYPKHPWPEDPTEPIPQRRRSKS